MVPSDGQSELCLAFDGGGTKTNCLLLELGAEGLRELARTTAPASNPAACGVTEAAESIRQAAVEALASLPASDARPVSRTAISVAGVVDPELRQQLTDAVTQLSLDDKPLAGQVRVFPDFVPIVLAASLTGPAAALISGTGSSAVARAESGAYVLNGGWGYLLGDEGSGYRLGRSALRCVFEELEEKPPQLPLVLAVCKQLEATNIGELKYAVYRKSNPRVVIAEVARTVSDLANAGDTLAMALVQEYCQELCEQGARVVRRAGLTPQQTPVAITGGLVQTPGKIQSEVQQALTSSVGFPEVQIVTDPLLATTRLLDPAVWGEPIEIFAGHQL